MNIQQDIIFIIILALGFLFLIIPSTPASKKWLDTLQKKSKRDLEKWKKRQRMLETLSRHERLNH